MNITMIVPYFRPEITATVHLMDDLAHDLAGYGAKVTVITGFPFRGTSRRIRNQFKNIKEEQLEDNLRILRVGRKGDEGKTFILRGVRYIKKTAAFYRTACRTPSDVFYIYSTPPVMGVIGGLLAKRAPTVYGLQDIFPDNLEAQRKIKNSSSIYKIFKAMEAYIYRRNTCIVTISREMKRNLIEKKVDENKIKIIGNWIDTNKIKHVRRDENPLFDQFQLDRNTFYVSYCGNLGYAQDLDLILKSAELVKKEAPEIRYLIVGSGACEAEVKKRIIKIDAGTISLFPMQPEEAAAYVYSLGDVGLVSIKPDMLESAMPSKTWTMMAASQPIVCTALRNTQLYEIIEESGAGIAVGPGDHEALARAVLRLYYDRKSLKRCGEQGRLYAEANLTREHATKEYFRVMTEIGEGRTNDV